MGKPVERQNHSLSFFILASLIAMCTAWSFYDEFIGRRPWKDYQEQIFGYEREKATQDLRYVERRLDSGEIKVVVDPSAPDQAVPVSEAKKKLEQLTHDLSKEARSLEKLDGQIKDADIRASDADLKVKYLKSEDDGLFYEYQHAEHAEALARASAAKQRSAGDVKGAEALLKEAEEHHKEFERVKAERDKKAEEIRKAAQEAEQRAKELAALKDEKNSKVGERERLKAAIDAALDPLITARTALETASKKRTELTQYWLTTYDNSVDRCQDCHAEIDKCGFSRPHEVVAALNAPNAKKEEVVARYCINPDTADHYAATAQEVCALTFTEAAEGEGGRCFEGGERTKVEDFISNYCGPEVPSFKVLSDEHVKSACLGKDDWGKLSAYVEDVAQKGVCEITLKPEGEYCVEGARRDQLVTWFTRHCDETAHVLSSLKKNPKACASGDEGKKLDAVKPVLFDYPVWAQTHPYRMEILGSNHPPEKFGCTTCHEGQGAQTKGVAGRRFEHGYDDHYWERPMLDLVAHKKYRPVSWGPPDSSAGVPGEWAHHEKNFAQSTCSKCHTEEVHLKFADTYSKGRRLVTEIGCHGCHPVEMFREFPRIGPTLTDLKKKTYPGFLLKWISYPKSFRPRTKMPNFWPEALDAQLRVREGSPELAQREDEVRKIVAYLWKNSEPSSLPPLPVAGVADRGRLLVQQVGCRGCHAFVPVEKLCTPEQIAAGKSRGTPKEPGECEVARSLSGSNARDFAPNLSNVGSKTNERWLFAWLKNPSSMWPQTRMPNLRLSDQEAADITAYLLTLKNGEPIAEDKSFDEDSPQLTAMAAEGSKLITKYGCAGCHLVKGHEDDPKIGVDLNEYGRKTVDLIDFGNAIPNPRHHTWYNFVDLKLRAPRAYRYERVETKMPQFDLNDDEVEAIMTFLKSRTGDKVPAFYQVAKNEQKTSVAHGDQLIEYYNCRGCHVIDGMGGSVRDVYAEDDLYRAPPILQQEGWRVQPEWLFGFLHDPGKIKLRPWLDIRMPTFPLGDQRATTLVRSFSAAANVPYPYLTVEPPKVSASAHAEAKAMVDELRCFNCHTAGEPRPDQDKSSLAPNLQLAKHRLRPDWIYAWIRNPQSLQEGTRMPSFFSPDAMDTVMYPKYFGGSQDAQIKALRDFVMTLPDSGNEGHSPQAKR